MGPTHLGSLWWLRAPSRGPPGGCSAGVGWDAGKGTGTCPKSVRPRTDQPPAANGAAQANWGALGLWLWAQLAAPTQRLTHSPEGGSARWKRPGRRGPHAAERERCGEQEARHREAGRETGGGRWDAAPDAGLWGGHRGLGRERIPACALKKVRFWAWNRTPPLLQPPPRATDRRCRDAALPAEGRACPIGRRAPRPSVCAPPGRPLLRAAAAPAPNARRRQPRPGVLFHGPGITGE